MNYLCYDVCFMVYIQELIIFDILNEMLDKFFEGRIWK